jgi:hypothetical protein
MNWSSAFRPPMIDDLGLCTHQAAGLIPLLLEAADSYGGSVPRRPLNNSRLVTTFLKDIE